MSPEATFGQAFGPCALRLSGLAMRALGWRPGEFWQATPAELAAALIPETVAQDAPLGRAELVALMEQEHE